jgi:anti-sigma factor RsiW
MNHPQREEWVPYLFGETTPEAREKLAEHLHHCPECAAEIAGWQRTLRKLDRWKLPRAGRRRARLELLARWAIAAALVLSLGFGLGRWSGPSLDPNALRVESEAAIEASLAAARSQITSELQTRFAVALDTAIAAVMNASSAETRRQLDYFSQAVDAARAEDRQQTLNLIESIQQQHAADLLAMRSDLETLASQTHDGIRSAWQGVFQLATTRAPAKSDDQP